MDAKDPINKASVNQDNKPSEPLNIPEFISEMTEYAGEKELTHRYREIEYFKATGEYPEHLINAKTKKNRSNIIRQFLLTAHNYILTETPVSPISQSKLCIIMRSSTDLRAIPFKSEVSSIFKILHIDKGQHLNLGQTRLRAKLFKIHWSGLTNDVESLWENCICYLVKSVQKNKKVKLN